MRVLDRTSGAERHALRLARPQAEFLALIGDALLHWRDPQRTRLSAIELDGRERWVLSGLASDPDPAVRSHVAVTPGRIYLASRSAITCLEETGERR